jgi:hypothetical protein
LRQLIAVEGPDQVDAAAEAPTEIVFFFVLRAPWVFDREMACGLSEGMSRRYIPLTCQEAF